MDTETAKSLAESVAAVASEHQEAQEAHRQANEAEAELLARVVEMAKPALKALSTRPKVSSTTTWHNVETHTEKTFAGWAGLRLAGDGADEDFPRDNSGSYEGCDLFLLPDGTWKELVYTGSWSRWQGAGSHWEAEERERSTAQVVAKYDVDDLVTELVAAIDKAKGTRAGSTKAALARAEKFRGLAVLLK